MKAVTAVFALALLSGLAYAQMGMPDPRQMSGMPLPAPEISPGTITVRVVRGDVTNIIPGQGVELTIGGETRTGKTDETGRATFESLKIGATVKVRAVVGSETLESQEFQVPEQGGVRVMLVATDPKAAKEAEEAARLAASSAQPGEVALGSQSRIHVELGEEAADVFYLLDLENAQKVPVQPKNAFEMELPSGASGSAVLEGSSPNATVAGRKVSVRGPFPPGATMAQVGFRLSYSRGGLRFHQSFPAVFDRPVITITKKLPGVTLVSSTFHDVREMANEGQTLLVAHASATAANTPLDVRIDGVPTHPVWPQYLALILVGILLAGGAYGAVTGPQRAAEKSAAARQLEKRREKLLTDLATLEQRHRTGAVADAQYDRRRAEIVDALERVYGEIDQGAAA